MDSDSDSAASEPVNLEEDREWEDAEDDTERIIFVSLFDDRTFSNIKDMLQYCKDEHGRDLWQARETLGLDDLGQIKMINYIRSEVKKGNMKPDLSNKFVFDDDKYLQPILEDDAVLYSLEDAFSSDLGETDRGSGNEVENLRQQLEDLITQFQNYREDVQRTLTRQLTTIDDAVSPPTTEKFSRSTDTSYFESYSFNGIHHIMLSDKIRTDAYRDFIYENKDIFAGKTVLDIGCGTGILSMFCAQAGAKQVIAVDNSDIISKARENIRLNKLDDRILCVRGKIEEVVLPVERVDIIVSEWMGYCLLYESMLDSVVHARDKYLVEGGLMVPSHATLKIAPLADSELTLDHINFWKDVYGFDMTPMLEKANEEVLIRSVDPKEVASGVQETDACTFRTFDLHTATVDDLSFAEDFRFTWHGKFEKLEGFVIWFDIIFARDRTLMKTDLRLEELKKHGLTVFTTGPFTEQTHWQQGVLLIEENLGPTEKAGDKLRLEGKYKEGDELQGTVTFSRTSKESRFLQIEIELKDSKPGPPLLVQKWKLE